MTASTTASTTPSTLITGVVPVVPTVFDAAEDLDLPGQRRVTDYLVDSGSDAMCVLANYSEQFSLTDDERAVLVADICEHAAGRIPVVVTTSHYSARATHARNLDAQARGAAMVMMMPPFFGMTMAVAEDAVVEWFHRVCDGLEIPVMVQDAPMSTTPLPAALIARLAREIPLVRYAKVEVARAASKLRALIGLAGDDLPGPFDGEESITLIPDLDAGAVGTMCSVAIPDVLGRVVRAHRGGRRDEAVDLWEAHLPMINYENRQCGLAAAKILLAAGGVIGSDTTRLPFAPVPPATRAEYLELARRRDPLVLRWAA